MQRGNKTKDEGFHLIGYASGLAGADIHCGDGPRVLQKSPFMSALKQSGIRCEWNAMVDASTVAKQPLDQAIPILCEQLATHVSKLIRNQLTTCVIGGDHSCAIGTWSGVYDALSHKGEVGLIWMDAHMDSHTPDTSETGRIHGMPLACLLGAGYPSLTSILHSTPKLKPENICLIGVRSFEAGEAAFLRRLNVKIFFMDEVRERGLAAVWQDAVNHVNQHTIGYGISLDLDGIDPLDAPGVDVPVPFGIRANDLCEVLSTVATDSRLIMTEIVEFDPTRDKDHLTEKLIVSLLLTVQRCPKEPKRKI